MMAAELLFRKYHKNDIHFQGQKKGVGSYAKRFWTYSRYERFHCITAFLHCKLSYFDEIALHPCGKITEDWRGGL